MPSRLTIVAALALIGVVAAATDALARSKGSHGSSSGMHASGTRGFGGVRGGFGAYPYAYVSRRSAYAEYDDPACVRLRQRVQSDRGLRWHRERRCGY